MYYTVLNAEKLSTILDKPIKKGTYFLKSIAEKSYLLNIGETKTLNNMYFFKKQELTSDMGFKHKFNIGDIVLTLNHEAKEIVGFYDNFSGQLYCFSDGTFAYENSLQKTTDDEIRNISYLVPKDTKNNDNVHDKKTSIINEDIIKKQISESTKPCLEIPLNQDQLNHYFESLSRAEFDDIIEVFESKKLDSNDHFLWGQKTLPTPIDADILNKQLLNGLFRKHLSEYSKEQKTDTVEVMQKEIDCFIDKYTFKTYNEDFKQEVKNSLDEFLYSNIPNKTNEDYIDEIIDYQPILRTNYSEELALTEFDQPFKFYSALDKMIFKKGYNEKSLDEFLTLNAPKEEDLNEIIDYQLVAPTNFLKEYESIKPSGRYENKYLDNPLKHDPLSFEDFVRETFSKDVSRLINGVQSEFSNIKKPKIPDVIMCALEIKKSQFNICDKVRIIKDLNVYSSYETFQETVNLKGFEGEVVFREVVSLHESRYTALNYIIEINGKKFDCITEDYLELVEKAKTNIVDVDKYPQEYEDIDGVLLPYSVKPVNLIQSYKKD